MTDDETLGRIYVEDMEVLLMCRITNLGKYADGAYVGGIFRLTTRMGINAPGVGMC